MTPVVQLPTFILQAQKRAKRRPEGKPTSKSDTLNGWVDDEEGFLRRWPNNTRPDIGTQRSQDYAKLAEQAKAANEAQLRAGFLDWLFVVDVDTPVHRECTPDCPTWKEES